MGEAVHDRGSGGGGLGVVSTPVRFASDFADAAVVLPLVGLVWVALGPRGTRWAMACAGTLGAMLVLKAISFRLTAPWPFSPSGHTASAAIVYGGLAWVLLRPRAGCVLPGVLAACVTAGIGWTRLALGAHSVAEVAAGAAIGTAGLVWLTKVVPLSGRAWPALVMTALVWSAVHGASLGIEEQLRRVILGW